MSDRILTPDYLNVDFDTFTTRQKQILKNTELFKDYNYEGSNISLINEWFAFLSEQQMFYNNQIAKNMYDDTVNLYENAHRLSKMKGFNPRGYISSRVDLTIRVNVQDENLEDNFLLGDQLYIPAWTPVFAEFEDDTTDSGTSLTQFVIPEAQLIEIPIDEDIYTNGYYEFNVPLVQGEYYSTSYKGKDLVDNKLILPFFKFNHDFTDLNSDSRMVLTVDNTPWTRVENFHSYILSSDTDEETDDIYMLTFDKYKRYMIEFASFRNVPEDLNDITIEILMTDGESGNVAANTITTLDSTESVNILYNNTRQKQISLESISIYNEIAAEGGADAQEIPEIVEAGKSNMNSQKRCVTNNDFIEYLKARSDILVANTWGEQELESKGNINEYNRLHISLIPSVWNTGTISTIENIWKPYDTDHTILKPSVVASDWQDTLKLYLKPRKMFNVFEVFEVPDLIYFAFDIGIKTKRLYNFVDVREAVRSKLDYYFKASNRSFNEKISFTKISNFIMDSSIKTTTNDWELVKGIDNLVFRNITISCDNISQEKLDFYSLPISAGGKYEYDVSNWTNIYLPNTENDYPQYTRTEFGSSITNKMKVIQLGYNQFPMLLKNACIFEKEED